MAGAEASASSLLSHVDAPRTRPKCARSQPTAISRCIVNPGHSRDDARGMRASLPSSHPPIQTLTTSTDR